MKVKIVKCLGIYYSWYKNLIGQNFNVKVFDGSLYQIDNRGKDFDNYQILREDCEIIPEEKEVKICEDCKGCEYSFLAAYWQCKELGSADYNISTFDRCPINTKRLEKKSRFDRFWEELSYDSFVNYDDRMRTLQLLKKHGYEKD